MTRTTRPTNCIECGLAFGKGVKRESALGVDMTGVNDDVCTDCYDYWGHENTHSDAGHEYILGWIGGKVDGHRDPTPEELEWMLQEIEMMPGCRVCQGMGPGIERPVKLKGLLDNKTWNSHAGHGHALTQAGRAACRREQAKAAGQAG